ncbi:hypothetical protein [Streptococcus oriscaviae]|uniref:Phage protein n=1 Tax=Streptococcus oriscaviae TaxID=2781599 RepID=A0ABX7YIW2_9STRE|nr:hypothetical protein [Streptococcus oriscaviae]QUE53556.1 hypothetical protein INT76_06740 [Streptococcus oriscaviae]
MSVKMYQIDYSRSDEKKFYSMNRSYEKLKELTYGEMCCEMHKDLEEMVDSGFLEASDAFKIEGDIAAYNELAEEFYHFVSED